MGSVPTNCLKAAGVRSITLRGSGRSGCRGLPSAFRANGPRSFTITDTVLVTVLPRSSLIGVGHFDSLSELDLFSSHSGGDSIWIKALPACRFGPAQVVVGRVSSAFLGVLLRRATALGLSDWDMAADSLTPMLSLATSLDPLR